MAQRVVWYEQPEEVLHKPLFFALHVMRYGLWRDVLTFKKYFTKSDIASVLASATAGILDKKSWLLWHTLVGNNTPPPMPVRNIPGVVR